MKKGDYIVIALILILSSTIYFNTKSKLVETNSKIVVVSVDGKEFARYTLGDTDDNVYTIDSEYGHNVFKVTSDGVHMVESDCKDQICVHQGHITKTGESIICLPNRLVISIEGTNDDNADEVDVVIR